MRLITAGTLTIGILAVLTGLVGAYVLRSVMMPPAAQVAETPPPTRVTLPVASAELPEGRAISVGDVALLTMTADELRQRKLPLDKVMLASEQIIGRKLRKPLKQGEAFLTTDIYLQGDGPRLSDKLPPSHRAFSVRVADDRGGTVALGSWVDVVFRSTPRRAQDGEWIVPEKTVTLLENIEVINVERPEVSSLQAAVGYVSKSPVVTLSVTPRQAEVLQTVEGRGEISLALRGEAANAQANLPHAQARPPEPRIEATPVSMNTEGVTLEKLLDIEPPNKPVTAEIYRRGVRQVNTFDGYGRLSRVTGVAQVLSTATNTAEPADQNTSDMNANNGN